MRLLRALVLALLLLVAPPAWGAVAFNAVGTSQTGTGTTASVPITISGCSNCALVAYIAQGTDTTGIGCTVNAGAETLAIIAGTNGGATTSTVMLGKTTSLTGAQTVVCSWTNSQVFVVNAMAFSGVNTATPFNGGTFATGASPFSTIITSTNGDMTTTVDEGTGSAPTTNQTVKYTTTASTYFAAGDIGPGTGTTTHTWTGSGNQFMSGANIVQAPAAGGAPQRSMTGVGL